MLTKSKYQMEKNQQLIAHILIYLNDNYNRY